MAHPKIGNMAPAFTLEDQEGNKVSLKDFKGKKKCRAVFLSQGHDTWLHRAGLRHPGQQEGAGQTRYRRPWG